MAQRLYPHSGEPTQVDIEAVIDDDLSSVPEEHHKFLVAHYQALVNYRPQPYHGKITLFRTRGQSLLGPFDPDLGWHKLTTEEVEVKEISGFHADLLQEPHVHSLARQLKESLDRC
jgi:thioesterase domain-containing protein